MARNQSYSSETVGPKAFVKELLSLYLLYSRGIPERVHASIQDIQRVESGLRDRLGFEVVNKRILEIGPGQFLAQMAYLSIHNSVIGVDRDLIVQGIRPLDYLKMLHVNGFRRTLKTVGRKLLGIDRRYASELMKQLGFRQKPRPTVLQMDVREIKFPGNSFDFVYCRSVLHHVLDPATALNQIAKVLRPGGVAYISVHLYTSPTGCLDPRVYTHRSNDLNVWPHLRPQLLHTVSPANVYLNKLRLSEWQKLFAEKMPGAQCILNRGDDPTLELSARTLQSQGELLDYSLDDLLTFEVVALWRKPPEAVADLRLPVVGLGVAR
jgi:SAM-dependent methyltransferase